MALLMPFLGTGKVMAEAKRFPVLPIRVPSLKAAHTAMRHSISRKTEQRMANSIASASSIWIIKSLRQARLTLRSATKSLCAVS